MIEQSKHHQSPSQISHEETDILAAQKNSLHFEVLYNRYFESVVRFVYQRVNTKEESFEIAQKVFVKALENIRKYTFQGHPFSAWLFRIAINEMNLQFRNNNKIRAINIDSACLTNLIDEMEEDNLEEKHQLIAAALIELPEYELQLIEMRFFEGRNFREIGNILNITENNAKVKLYRTLDKIKIFLNVKK